MMTRGRSGVGRLLVVATTFVIGATAGAQEAPAANAAGWLDRSFGQNGTATLALPAWSPPAATANRMEAAFIIRSPTGFVAVHATHHRAESATDDGVGYRLDGLTSDGRRDPAFNGGAPRQVVFFPKSGLDPIRIYGLLPRPGGFIVVGEAKVDQGPTGRMVFSHLYRWNGTADASYGASGRAHPFWLGAADPGPGAAVALSDGSVRVCTHIPPNDYLDPGIVLVGWDPGGNGAEGGIRYLDLGAAATCSAMVADAADRLIVAGTGRIDARRAAIVGRFSADGATDATFGDAGLRVLQWSMREFTAHQLVRLGSSGFALGGQAYDAAGPPLAYTARITGGGAIDSTYGYGGVYRYPGGSAGSVLRSLDVAGNNRLVAGIARLDAGGNTEVLSRIVATTGRLDGAFGRYGTVVVPHRAVDTVVDGSLRTITTGNRVNSATQVLVQRRIG